MADVRCPSQQAVAYTTREHLERMLEGRHPLCPAWQRTELEGNKHDNAHIKKAGTQSRARDERRYAYDFDNCWHPKFSRRELPLKATVSCSDNDVDGMIVDRIAHTPIEMDR